jgi:hypothetical protein
VSAKPRTKRVSITVELDDYSKLKEFAATHKPPLSLRYVCQYAIQSLLDRARNPQFRLKFGDPTDTKGKDG